MIKEHVCWEFYLGDPVSSKEPYDEDSRPVLLSEDRVKALLKCRSTHQSKHRFDLMSDVLHSMKSAGMPVPESTRDKESGQEIYPITETEHEQMLQAFRVLHTKGNISEERHDVVCPYCHSGLIAALVYTVKDKDYYASANKVVLTFKRERYRVSSNKNNTRSAYLCLCCGTEFGELKWEPEANNE